LHVDANSVERSIVVRAARARVWRALADTGEFGAWFGMRLDGNFAPGTRLAGRITTPGYEHLVVELVVDRVEPERLLSFRWHPHAVDPGVDYATEPMTLVRLVLADVPGGTKVTVSESGFDALPPHRRDTARLSNGDGWEVQVGNLRGHVDG
jgi:uncharacterized protein YndB with AHSA1/START domain